jgi:hypothetical protein
MIGNRVVRIPEAGEIQPGMQHDLPAGRIMMQDQRLGIVEQHLARHTADMPSNQLSCFSWP